jgi:hypothetical protein
MESRVAPADHGVGLEARAEERAQVSEERELATLGSVDKARGSRVPCPLSERGIPKRRGQRSDSASGASIESKQIHGPGSSLGRLVALKFVTLFTLLSEAAGSAS